MSPRWGAAALLLALGAGRLAGQEPVPGATVRLYQLAGSVSTVPVIPADQKPNLCRIVPAIDLRDARGDFGELQDNFVTVITARLRVATEGLYGLRLISDDGSLLFLDDELLLDHDGPHGAVPKDAEAYLYPGSYDLRVEHYEGGGAASVRLEWRTPGAADFELVPTEALTTAPSDTADVTPGGKRFAPRPVRVAGEDAPLASLHPGYNLVDLAPEGLRPRVAGLAVLPDGRVAAALVAPEPGVAVFPQGGGAPEWICRGTEPPLGLAALAGRLYYASATGIYAASERPERIWTPPAGITVVAGPAAARGGLYVVGGPTDGARQTWRVTPDGRAEALPVSFAASALAADEQALWFAFLDGLYRVPLDAPRVERVAALPAGLLSRTPTQVALTDGAAFVGDLSYGGLRRVTLQAVDGVVQGAVTRFTQGLPAGVRSVLALPDGSLVLGGDGGRPGYGQLGKRGDMLAALRPKPAGAFQIEGVRALANGLEVRFSRPLAEREGWDPFLYRLTAWPADRIEGDGERLDIRSVSVAPDRRRVFLEVPECKPGQVVRLRVSPALSAEGGGRLWGHVAWCTLNGLDPARGEVRVAPPGALPNTLSEAERAAGWRLLFDGRSTEHWRGFRQPTFPSHGWVVEDGCLHVLEHGGGGDIITVDKFENFELAIDWCCSPGANSGIMILVTEEVSPSWYSGPEIQILDEPTPNDSRFSCGSMYELYPPQNKQLRPAGEWNSFRLVLRDGHGEHWLNGIKICEYQIGSDDWNARVAQSKFKDMPRFGKERVGHIVLQDHGHELWFRNIKVRELTGER